MIIRIDMSFRAKPLQNFRICPAPASRSRPDRSDASHSQTVPIQVRSVAASRVLSSGRNRTDNVSRQASWHVQTVRDWRRRRKALRNRLRKHTGIYLRLPLRAMSLPACRDLDVIAASEVAGASSAALTQLRSRVSNPAMTMAPANVPRKNSRREISPLILSCLPRFGMIE